MGFPPFAKFVKGWKSWNRIYKGVWRATQSRSDSVRGQFLPQSGIPKLDYIQSATINQVKPPEGCVQPGALSSPWARQVGQIVSSCEVILCSFR